MPLIQALPGPGIASVPTLQEALSEYGTRVMSLPVSSSVLLLYYRRDVFSSAGLPPPRTWAEAVAAAARFNGTDLDGDGLRDEDWGICLHQPPGCPTAAAPLLAVVASLAQAQGRGEGFHFRPDVMRNVYDTVAWEAALAVLAALSRFAPPPSVTVEPSAAGPGPDCSYQHLFGRGRCAMALSLAGQFKYDSWNSSAIGTAAHVSSAVRGRIGAAVLPGSAWVLDWGANRLVPCDEQRCSYGVTYDSPAPTAPPDELLPYVAHGGVSGRRALRQAAPAAAPGRLRVNHAPYVPAGLSLYVAGNASEGERLAAYSLATELSRDATDWAHVMSPASPGGPMRLEQLDDSSLPRWLGAGYHADDAAAFLAATRAALSSGNAAHELRCQGASRFSGAALATVQLLTSALASRNGAADGSSSNSSSELLASVVASSRRLFAEALPPQQLAAMQASYKTSMTFGAAAKPPYQPSVFADGAAYSPHAAANSSSGAGAHAGAGGGSSTSKRLAVGLGVALPCAAAVLLAAALFVWGPKGWWRRLRKPRRQGRIVAPGVGPNTSLVVTDIQDSTRLWETLPAPVMDSAIQLHHVCIRRCATSCGGYESATEGDSFILAFHSPQAAMLFCLVAQEQLTALAWPQELLQVDCCRPVWVREASRTAAAAPGGSLRRVRSHAHTPRDVSLSGEGHPPVASPDDAGPMRGGDSLTCLGSGRSRRDVVGRSFAAVKRGGLRLVSLTVGGMRSSITNLTDSMGMGGGANGAQMRFALPVPTPLKTHQLPALDGSDAAGNPGRLEQLASKMPFRRSNTGTPTTARPASAATLSLRWQRSQLPSPFQALSGDAFLPTVQSGCLAESPATAEPAESETDHQAEPEPERCSDTLGGLMGLTSGLFETATMDFITSTADDDAVAAKPRTQLPESGSNLQSAANNNVESSGGEGPSAVTTGGAASSAAGHVSLALGLAQAAKEASAATRPAPAMRRLLPTWGRPRSASSVVSPPAAPHVEQQPAKQVSDTSPSRASSAATSGGRHVWSPPPGRQAAVVLTSTLGALFRARFVVTEGEQPSAAPVKPRSGFGRPLMPSPSPAALVSAASFEQGLSRYPTGPSTSVERSRETRPPVRVPSSAHQDSPQEGSHLVQLLLASGVPAHHGSAADVYDPRGDSDCAGTVTPPLAEPGTGGEDSTGAGESAGAGPGRSKGGQEGQAARSLPQCRSIPRAKSARSRQANPHMHFASRIRMGAPPPSTTAATAPGSSPVDSCLPSSGGLARQDTMESGFAESQLASRNQSRADMATAGQHQHSAAKPMLFNAAYAPNGMPRPTGFRSRRQRHQQEAARSGHHGAAQSRLLLAGLRVRMGVHSGIRLASDVGYSSVMQRYHYAGRPMAAAKAVAGAASGGMVLLSAATHELLTVCAEPGQPLLLRAPTSSVSMLGSRVEEQLTVFWHAGVHVLDEHLPPLEVLTAATPAQVPRWAVLPSPAAGPKFETLVPGVQAAPIGNLAIATVTVSGARAIAAANLGVWRQAATLLWRGASQLCSEHGGFMATSKAAALDPQSEPVGGPSGGAGCSGGQQLILTAAFTSAAAAVEWAADVIEFGLLAPWPAALLLLEQAEEIWREDHTYLLPGAPANLACRQTISGTLTLMPPAPPVSRKLNHRLSMPNELIRPSSAAVPEYRSPSSSAVPDLPTYNSESLPTVVRFQSSGPGAFGQANTFLAHAAGAAGGSFKTQAAGLDRASSSTTNTAALLDPSASVGGRASSRSYKHPSRRATGALVSGNGVATGPGVHAPSAPDASTMGATGLARTQTLSPALSTATISNTGMDNRSSFFTQASTSTMALLPTRSTFRSSPSRAHIAMERSESSSACTSNDGRHGVRSLVPPPNMRRRSCEHAVTSRMAGGRSLGGYAPAAGRPSSAEFLRPSLPTVLDSKLNAVQRPTPAAAAAVEMAAPHDRSSCHLAVLRTSAASSSRATPRLTLARPPPLLPPVSSGTLGTISQVSAPLPAFPLGVSAYQHLDSGNHAAQALRFPSMSGGRYSQYGMGSSLDANAAGQGPRVVELCPSIVPAQLASQMMYGSGTLLAISRASSSGTAAASAIARRWTGTGDLVRDGTVVSLSKRLRPQQGSSGGVSRPVSVSGMHQDHAGRAGGPGPRASRAGSQVATTTAFLAAGSMEADRQPSYLATRRASQSSRSGVPTSPAASAPLFLPPHLGFPAGDSGPLALARGGVMEAVGEHEHEVDFDLSSNPRSRQTCTRPDGSASLAAMIQIGSASNNGAGSDSSRRQTVNCFADISLGLPEPADASGDQQASVGSPIGPQRSTSAFGRLAQQLSLPLGSRRDKRRSAPALTAAQRACRLASQPGSPSSEQGRQARYRSEGSVRRGGQIQPVLSGQGSAVAGHLDYNISSSAGASSRAPHGSSPLASPLNLSAAAAGVAGASDEHCWDAGNLLLPPELCGQFLCRGLRLRCGVEVGPAVAEINCVTGALSYVGPAADGALALALSAPLSQVLVSAAAAAAAAAASNAAPAGAAAVAASSALSQTAALAASALPAGSPTAAAAEPHLFPRPELQAQLRLAAVGTPMPRSMSRLKLRSAGGMQEGEIQAQAQAQAAEICVGGAATAPGYCSPAAALAGAAGARQRLTSDGPAQQQGLGRAGRVRVQAPVQRRAGK
ncbi:hypothetical protein HYH03_014678 [Edaphochlamys debaryana]|uniref:Guanylate cyclase domain-containing protein n=1 Tax=Edaphochlamys debaryana TaxID=47281 RepID=A0A835XQX3_9CHLO|nr:hypothetical protein HYH03_014678 [Edaphochlamys debaryana]|eukprot:KAG2486621.1 hypothetical protein HYH03_014678 [Edaphochlamys debaryana]